MKINCIKSMKAVSGWIALCVFVIFYLSACQTDKNLGYLTTNQVNMTGYFENDTADFSQFLKILNITGYSGFLGAYGTYTCFAPTNEAINTYLKENGKTSVTDFTVDELKDMVKLHLLQDTISTSQFTDGKLSIPSMYGQYLITGSSVKNGVAKIRINRQANIVHKNIPVGNGIIHSIDAVLKPAKYTVAQMLEQNPDYSIFTAALKSTGFYDTLNFDNSSLLQANKKWYTVVAIPDSVYIASNIFTYSDLTKKYSNTGFPSNPKDSLNLYIAYHITSGLDYVADIVTTSTLNTLAPNEVVTTKLISDSVLLNHDVINGVLEKGSQILRDSSDNSATNGVYHSALEDYAIKIRKATAVYWDICDQPEIRKMSAYHKAGSSVPLGSMTFSGMSWTGGGDADIQYIVAGSNNTTPFYFNDYLNIQLRTAVISQITFTTPLLIKGKYKVWLCWRRAFAQQIQTFFDGNPLPKILDLSEYLPTRPSAPKGSTYKYVSLSDWDNYLQGIGYKRYFHIPNAKACTVNTNIGKCIGTIDVTTTSTHKLQFVVLNSVKGFNMLDMIQFIPVDDDQDWPKFCLDGSVMQRPPTATYDDQANPLPLTGVN